MLSLGCCKLVFDIRHDIVRHTVSPDSAKEEIFFFFLYAGFGHEVDARGMQNTEGHYSWTGLSPFSGPWQLVLVDLLQFFVVSLDQHS